MEDDRIRAIAGVIREDGDPVNTVYVIRRELRAEHADGYEAGYADCLRDQHEAAMLADGVIGPPLDEYGRHPEGEYNLWHMVVYVPDSRDGKVLGLLAANGIEVYRAWPVETGQQHKAAMDECEASLRTPGIPGGKDGTDDG